MVVKKCCKTCLWENTAPQDASDMIYRTTETDHAFTTRVPSARVACSTELGNKSDMELRPL